MAIEGLVDILERLVDGEAVQLRLVLQDDDLPQQRSHTVHHALANLLAHVASFQAQHHLHTRFLYTIFTMKPKNLLNFTFPYFQAGFGKTFTKGRASYILTKNTKLLTNYEQFFKVNRSFP